MWPSDSTGSPWSELWTTTPRECASTTLLRRNRLRHLAQRHLTRQCLLVFTPHMIKGVSDLLDRSAPSIAARGG